MERKNKGFLEIAGGVIIFMFAIVLTGGDIAHLTIFNGFLFLAGIGLIITGIGDLGTGGPEGKIS